MSHHPRIFLLLNKPSNRSLNRLTRSVSRISEPFKANINLPSQASCRASDHFSQYGGIKWYYIFHFKWLWIDQISHVKWKCVSCCSPDLITCFRWTCSSVKYSKQVFVLCEIFSTNFPVSICLEHVSVTFQCPQNADVMALSGCHILMRWLDGRHDLPTKSVCIRQPKNTDKCFTKKVNGPLSKSRL